MTRSLGLVLALLVCVLALPRAAPAAAVPRADPPALTAAGAVLWDPADDRVLFGVAETTPRPMASTTKIMTVLLALEAGTIGDTVTVSPTAAAVGEASLGLQPGQRIPMESLVAGLILRSGNDAAVALAEHVAGSESAFVAAMNVRAVELGLAGTRFLNPHGLTNDADHRAAPLDLARLAHEAMAHEVFARYAGAASATVPGLPPMENRNELLGTYPWATGVKTGFTRLAGDSLVASAERDGRVLYAVVLDSDDRFGEAAALLDHGFTAFRRVVPAAEGAEITRYRWWDADVGVLAGGELGATAPIGAEATWHVRLVPAATRPVSAGDELGRGELRVEGHVEHEVPLVAAADVPTTAVAEPAAAVVGGAVQESLRAFVRLADLDRAA